MKAEIKTVLGTEKYPFACVIIIDNIWRTDRICDQEKASLIENFIVGQDDINKIRMFLAKACIDLHQYINFK